MKNKYSEFVHYENIESTKSASSIKEAEMSERSRFYPIGLSIGFIISCLIPLAAYYIYRSKGYNLPGDQLILELVYLLIFGFFILLAIVAATFFLNRLVKFSKSTEGYKLGSTILFPVAIFALIIAIILIKPIGPDHMAFQLMMGKRSFRNINMENTNLSSLDLVRIDLSGANLENSIFRTRHDLRETILKGANLRGADLWKANLWKANLSGANLTGADLKQADLSVADLTGADLTGADLTGADLSFANLSGAILGGANLVRAELGGADLTGADLTGADLTGAKLLLSNMYGTDIIGSEPNLRQAVYDDSTMWPNDFNEEKSGAVKR